MKICQIVDDKYLEKGSRGWPGNMKEAQLIVYNGASSKNAIELFESYETGESLLPLLKNWNYDEVICSALTYKYNFTIINYLEWARIQSFLLFPYNKTTAAFILSFLKNNDFSLELSQKEVFSGARFLLMEVPPTGIRVHNLLNFLSFLQISETDKNMLVEECRKAKNYIPVLRYLQNIKNALLETDSGLLDIDSDLKARKKRREETLLDIDRGPPKPAVNIFGNILFGFIVFLITIRKLSGVRDNIPIIVCTTPIGFVMPSENSNVELSAAAENFTEASTNVEGMPASCNLNLVGGQIIPGPPLGASSSSQRATTNPLLIGTDLNLFTEQNDTNNLSLSDLSLENVTVSLENVTPLTSKEEVGNMLKKELEKPTFTLINKDGKKEKANYVSYKKKAGGFKVTVDPSNSHVTISQNKIQYSDFPKDFGTFNKRLSFINDQLKEKGNYHIFQLQGEVVVQELVGSSGEYTVEKRTVKTGKMNVDHPEGSKALAATNRTKEQAVGIIKPETLHNMHTAIRKTVENSHMFEAVRTGKNSVTYKFLHTNRTFLSQGHTMETYFDFRVEDSGKSLDLVPDSFFTPTESREHYKTAEAEAIIIAKDDYLNVCNDQGIAPRQMLPDMKMRSTFNQAETDTNRFLYDLRSSKTRCDMPNSKETIIPSLVEKQGSRVVTHNTVVRLIIRGTKRLFGMEGDPDFGQTLIGRCDRLLTIQSDKMRKLNNVLIDNGVTLGPDYLDIFETHAPGAGSPVVGEFEEKVANMSLKVYDNLIGQVGGDIYDQPRIQALYKLGNRYILTRKLNGQSSALSSSSSISNLSHAFEAAFVDQAEGYQSFSNSEDRGYI